MYSVILVLCCIISQVYGGADENGGCYFASGTFQMDLIAGQNEGFFYVDKLNQQASFNTANGPYYYDYLIQSPTEGYNFVGTPGGQIIDTLHEDTTTYITFSVVNSGDYLFSSQVNYFGVQISNIYTPSPVSFQFSVSVVSGGVVYTVGEDYCRDIVDGVITCDVPNLAFFSEGDVGFSISQVTSVTFTLYPSCAVTPQQYCSELDVPADGIGYYCANNGNSFYECLSGAFASQSNEQPCPPGTLCQCEAGEECSDGGLVSPCTSA